MPDSTAKTRLKAMTAWNQEPLLTEPEIDALLDMFSIADSDGYTKEDEEWVPTYNLRGAAREGWKWKLGRCADLVSADLDGDRMSSNQLFTHCEKMVAQYAGAGSPSVGQGTNDEYTFFSED